MIAAGGLVLDEAAMELRRADQSETVERISPSQARILALLMSHPGVVMTRDRLLDLLYHDATDPPDGKIIDVFISKLRSAVRRLGGNPLVIGTVWGGGYRLNVTATRVAVWLTPEQRVALDVLISQAPLAARGAAGLVREALAE